MDPDHVPLNPTSAMTKTRFCGVCDRKFYAKTDLELEQLYREHFDYTHPVNQDQGTI